MSRRVKYIIMGLFICAALSFATVSCMQLFSGKNKDYIDMDSIDLVQTKEPEAGAPIATIKTTLGDITAVLYPDKAPETVKHFTELAKSGYYDNTYVFNCEQGYYFAAGSPKKNGDLDESKPDGIEEWEQELSHDLWTFKGALCSIPTGDSGGFWDKLTGKSKVLNGSRFTILGSEDFTEEFKQQLLEKSEYQKLAEKYIELRGVPALAQTITVFGQVYDGFDVLEKLLSLETAKSSNEEVNIPVDDVMIKTIEIGSYKTRGEWALTESVKETTAVSATTVAQTTSSK